MEQATARHETRTKSEANSIDEMLVGTRPDAYQPIVGIYVDDSDAKAPNAPIFGVFDAS